VTTGGDSVEQNPNLRPVPAFRDAIDAAINAVTNNAPNSTFIEDPKVFYTKVKEHVRAQGFLVSYDNRGDERFDSELSIWRGCHLESYQLITSAGKLRRNPGAFRSVEELETCTHACILQYPLKDGYEVRLDVKPHGPNQWDGTPLVFNDNRDLIPPAGWTGGCQARACLISPEKDPEAGKSCTWELCGKSLKYEVRSGSALVNWVQGYTAKVTPAAGGAVLRASCEASPDVFVDFTIGR